jgi:predicted membrane chloride channel (bestrophin family)
LEPVRDRCARPRAAPAAGRRRHAYRSRRRRRRRLAGFDNFEQCRYLNETPLPLPWDQLITVVLIVWQVTVPVVTVASTINEPLGCVLSVTIVWMLWALNEVARDVEDPFYNEPNDM